MPLRDYLQHRCFNSRPHEEVDKSAASRASSNDCFNSRPHEEVDREICAVLDTTDVSTHDLTKRSTGSFGDSDVAIVVFQLTTSRRGRHRANAKTSVFVNVSTHDLTKRSTTKDLIDLITDQVSTHDLTKRSTLK